MLCEKCGMEVDQNSRFCPNCGKEIKDTTVSERQNDPPIPQQDFFLGPYQIPQQEYVVGPYPIPQQGQQTSESGERLLGILLCVVGSVDCFLSTIILNFYNFGFLSLWIIVMFGLPLIAVFLLVGQKEISLSKIAKKTNKASSSHLILGITMIALVIVSLLPFLAGFIGNSIQKLDRSASSYYLANLADSFVVLIVFLYYFILIACAVLLFIAANKKKKEGIPGSFFIVAGILLLANVVLSTSFDYFVMPYLLQEAHVSIQTLNSISSIGGRLARLLYNVAIIVLGAGLMSKTRIPKP